MGRKVQKATIYREIANNINAGSLRTQFYLVENEPGKKQILEEIPQIGVVKFVDQARVVDLALQFVVNVDCGAGSDLTHREMVEAVKYWMSISRSIKMPVYLGELRDMERYCFQRLPFNYDDEPKETPVLDEMMRRCTNSEALQMFVGSLFVENSSRYQYLWLYGPGGEGKGCFGRALARVIGMGATTMVVPKTDSQKQFLAYSLLGKRLCIFPECSNFSFPNDPLFKQFTGHDDVWIEQKGKQGYNAPINCKFMFFSNERAGVAGTDANTRRLIYSEIGKPSVKYSTQVYDALLAEEMPSFVIKCRDKYLEKCPMGDDIPFNDETTRQLIEFNEERFEVITEQFFEIGENFEATPAEMQRVKANTGMSLTEYRQFIEYLRRKAGIECKVEWNKVSQKPYKCWHGIKILTQPSSNITPLKNRG